MAKTDRPLTEEERGEVEHHRGSALGWFGDRAASASPDQVQQWIYETVNALRAKPPAETHEAGMTMTAISLGCLWGQAVCDLLGWVWAAVRLEPGSEFYGVVSPSRSHVVFPLHYLQELLGDPERDQTSLLLYNMLKAGSLPPASPGEYRVLG
jgi:hypothetical protein